jgi:hypothetical protein
MKPLALVLAAVLGSGCIFVDDDDCFGTVTLEWDFQRSDGTVPGGTVSQICAAAGVTDVDVYMDGTFVQSFFCTEGGATIIDVRSGTYLFTVEGIDASGNIRYRHHFDVDARSCGDLFLAPRLAAGVVNLDYSLPGSVCATTGTFMHYDIRDEITGQLVPNQVSLTPATCPDDIIRALPAGFYTLEWMEERASASLSSAVYGRDCTFRPFEIGGGQLTTVPVTIVNASVACTHFQ